MPIGPRTVRHELLDELDPSDPRAVRARRDLERVNRVMGSCRILTRALRRSAASRACGPPARLLELGAGDGTLMLRIAERLATTWPAVELTLLDRQQQLAPTTGIVFAHLGWTLRPLRLDALEWARAPTRHQLPTRWDTILANLFLHHFEDGPLAELLSAIAVRCDAFIACEPARRLTALIGSHLLPALGVSAITRHDAVASVRGGFLDRELSRLWPATATGWRLEERDSGPFSHLFLAIRGKAN